jgi:hypothetical protein
MEISFTAGAFYGFYWEEKRAFLWVFEIGMR